MPISQKIPEVRPLNAIEERKKLQTSVIRRLFITQHFSGKGIVKDMPFGHYMCCGPQGSGKTATCTWLLEYFILKYSKHNPIKPQLGDYRVGHIFSNFINPGSYSLPGYGKIYVESVNKSTLFDTIYKLACKKDGSSRYKKDDKIMNFFLLDEFHTYFPDDGAMMTKEDKKYMYLLKNRFSQLRKAHTFVVSTCQVYGDLNINLRRQCLEMVSTRKSKLSNKLVSDFYKKEDILCDELGNWSGIPHVIRVHGLSSIPFDTSRLINE